MSRTSDFNRLKVHAWYGKVYASLSADEIKLAYDFIDQHKSDSVADFRAAIISMGMNNYTKRTALLQDLLLASAAGTGE
jgi:hypothetical protein